MTLPKKTKNRKTIIVATITLIVLVFVWFSLGILLSDKLDVEKIIVGNGDVQIKVAHISDIHYPDNVVSLNDIVKELTLFQPDFVFLTGDMLTSSATRKDTEEFEKFLKELSAFRVFAVLGNHELILSSLDYYKTCLRENNIALLENELSLTSIKNRAVAVVGVSDKESYNYSTINGLNRLPTNVPILLLAHRPEKWNEYLTGTSRHRPTAVFAGHAHGGQLQIFGKGVYAPGYGYFPKYYDGLYNDKTTDSVMVVSRGLGNSIFPFRFYNKYHLPLVTLSV